MTEILFLIAGLIIGITIIWFVAKSRYERAYAEKFNDFQNEKLREIKELEAKSSSFEARTEELRKQVKQMDFELQAIRDRLSEEIRSKADIMARYEEVQKSQTEQMRIIDEMEKKLGEKFSALSLNALSKNSEEFIKFAQEKLKSESLAGLKDLEGKKELIDQNIEAIGKTLREVQRRIEDVGKVSGDKITEIATLIKKHEEVTSKLNETTEHLRHALASSKKRGEWGERMAEDIIRLVGMSEGINYLKQKRVEGSLDKPDFTFLMPNGLKINMDVKFPHENYMHYLNAISDHEKKRYKEELLKNTKAMIKQVTNRNYINTADNTVDYVIIFIPNEQVYSFINEADPSIMDEALKNKVILCSPFTLYAVLAVVRQAAENFNLERTASEILNLLADFSKQWSGYKEKFRILGERIDAAKKEYDAILTTRTNTLDKSLRKIEDFKIQNSITTDTSLKTDEILLP